MTEPTTRQEIIDWFCAAHFRTGEIRYDVEIITQFVDSMLDKPNPNYRTEIMCAEAVWDAILSGGYGFLWDTPERRNIAAGWAPPLVMSWVTREGKVYTCQWAGHARMLRYMGMKEEDAENLGWLKITRTGQYCMFKRSRAQIDTLRCMGLDTDKEVERTKPRYDI
jgi:hypothetical protein